ncbi:MAG: ABC transporter substrate-binding protein [Acidimicrobiales bacterium]
MNKTSKFMTLALATALMAASCGSDAESTSASSETTDASSAATCDMANLPLHAAGTLTVATGEEVYPPWMTFGDPAAGGGFESELVFALADQLGVGRDHVEWVGTGFDEAILAGEKNYDFNIQQYSITPERSAVVDFSDGYYDVEQAIVAIDGSAIAGATSIADLKDAKIGAAIGTTSLTYAEDVIAPADGVAVYDDNAAAKAAFDAGQLDGMVFDLPTAYYVTAVEFENSSIIGILPRQGEADQLGMLFEKGSPLVGCVNEALAALRSDGTLESLENEFLSAGGSIPTFTE